MFGAPNAGDIALRCAYYGKAEITAKDMKAGYKRDNDVCAFAVIWNKRLYSRSELRTLFQEGQSNGELYSRFERNFNLVKKKWDEIDKRGTEQPADEGGKRMTAIETATDALTKSVTALAKELADTKRLLIIIGIALAVLVYWSKN